MVVLLWMRSIIMDVRVTAVAFRTHNLLMSEGRDVLAALLIE
jgi:uncharacterized protein